MCEPAGDSCCYQLFLFSCLLSSPVFLCCHWLEGVHPSVLCLLAAVVAGACRVLDASAKTGQEDKS
jgi:hypothetical protein